MRSEVAKIFRFRLFSLRLDCCDQIRFYGTYRLYQYITVQYYSTTVPQYHLVTVGSRMTRETSTASRATALGVSNIVLLFMIISP